MPEGDGHAADYFDAIITSEAAALAAFTQAMPKIDPSIWRVYRITHKVTNKMYIGISTDPARRFKQHKRSPPTRMKRDAAAAPGAFEDNFVMDLLTGQCCKRMAKLFERKFIRTHKTTGPQGYNYLKRDGVQDPQFWAIQQAKGM